jgi:hypothetical protein
VFPVSGSIGEPKPDRSGYKRAGRHKALVLHSRSATQLSTSEQGNDVSPGPGRQLTVKFCCGYPRHPWREDHYGLRSWNLDLRRKVWRALDGACIISGLKARPEAPGTRSGEFRDNASGMLRAKDPILVTRRGRLAGIFFPRPETTLPVELKREMFSILSAEVARQVRKRKLSEEDVLAGFADWRKAKRQTGRKTSREAGRGR